MPTETQLTPEDVKTLLSSDVFHGLPKEKQYSALRHYEPLHNAEPELMDAVIAKSKPGRFRGKGASGSFDEGFGLGKTEISRGRTWAEKGLGAVPSLLNLGTNVSSKTKAAATGALLGGTAEAIRQLGAASAEASPVKEIKIPGIVFGMPSTRLDFRKAFGEAETTSKEAFLKIGEQAAYGAGAGLLAGTISSAMPRVAGFFKRNLSPQQMSDIALLDREGIPWTAGDIRPQGAAEATENFLKNTLLGGRIMARAASTKAAALDLFKQKVLNPVGKLLKNEEVGVAVKDAIEGKAAKLFAENGIFQTAYKRFQNIYGGEVDTSIIRKGLAPIRDAVSRELELVPSLHSTESPSRFYTMLEDLSHLGESKGIPIRTGKLPKMTMRETVTGYKSVPEGNIPDRSQFPSEKISYEDIWNLKKTVDSIIRNNPSDPLRTRAFGLLKRIHNVLDAAMEQSAKSSSPGGTEIIPVEGGVISHTSPEKPGGEVAAAAIRSLNRAYGAAKNLFEGDSTVAALRTVKDPEKVVGIIFPKGAVTPPKEILEAVGASRPDVIASLHRRLLENAIEETSKEVEGIGVTSAASFGKRFDKMIESLEASRMPSDKLDGIREFVRASKRAQSSRTILNPASGRQVVAGSQLAAMGGAATALFTGHPLIAAGQTAYVVSPYMLARALTNPRTAKLLAEGFALGKGTQAAIKWTPLAINAIRQANSTPRKRLPPVPE